MRKLLLAALVVSMSGCTYYSKTTIKGTDMRYGLAAGKEMVVEREVNFNGCQECKKEIPEVQ